MASLVLANVGSAFRGWLRLCLIWTQIGRCLWSWTIQKSSVDPRSSAVLKSWVDRRSRRIKLGWVRRRLRHLWWGVRELSYLSSWFERHINRDLLNRYLLRHYNCHVLDGCFNRHFLNGRVISKVCWFLARQTCRVTFYIFIKLCIFFFKRRLAWFLSYLSTKAWVRVSILITLLVYALLSLLNNIIHGFPLIYERLVKLVTAHKVAFPNALVSLAEIARRH
jgi:hypothetical protein